MSILADNPINDASVREVALINDIVRHYNEGKRPYIGYMDSGVAKSIEGHLSEMRFRADMFDLKGDTLKFNKKRCGVLGRFDWEHYGIGKLSNFLKKFFTELKEQIYCFLFRICYISYNMIPEKTVPLIIFIYIFPDPLQYIIIEMCLEFFIYATVSFH